MHTTTSTTEQTEEEQLIQKVCERMWIHLRAHPAVVSHSIRVGNYLRSIGCELHICVAGYLFKIRTYNDILNLDEISRLFDRTRQVATIIDACTYKKGECAMDMPSEFALMNRIQEVGPDALLVKLAELLDLLKNTPSVKENRGLGTWIISRASHWIELGKTVLSEDHQAVLDLQMAIQYVMMPV